MHIQFSTIRKLNPLKSRVKNGCFQSDMKTAIRFIIMWWYCVRSHPTWSMSAASTGCTKQQWKIIPHDAAAGVFSFSSRPADRAPLWSSTMRRGKTDGCSRSPPSSAAHSTPPECVCVRVFVWVCVFVVEKHLCLCAVVHVFVRRCFLCITEHSRKMSPSVSCSFLHLSFCLK